MAGRSHAPAILPSGGQEDAEAWVDRQGAAGIGPTAGECSLAGEQVDRFPDVGNGATAPGVDCDVHWQ